MPDTIQFRNGNQIVNKYDAGGRKLKTEYFTLYTPIEVPMMGVYNWNNRWDVLDTWEVQAYVDNFEYSELKYSWDDYFVLKRINNPEGYVSSLEAPMYHYYRRDHLGNVREVMRKNAQSSGVTVQRTQYYPSGLPWAYNSGDNPEVQSYKYNEKEFVEMHGWDSYDYGARVMYPAVGPQFMSVDPLCEKYYWISPYAYCLNNPVLFIDPDGNEIKVYREGGQSGGKATVVIQITGKIVNNSSVKFTTEQLQVYADRLTSSISSSFTGEGESINYKAEAKITVATDNNMVTSTDHTFTIQDQGNLPGSKGNNDVTGNAVKGQKNINISQHILDRKEATTGEYVGTGKNEKGLGTLERTGPHEFGHSAVLGHPTTGSSDNNLMHQTKETNAGKTITENQVLQIEKAFKDNELNK